jgi:hypothetical protein
MRGGERGEGRVAMWCVRILQIGIHVETNTDWAVRENVKTTSLKKRESPLMKRL